MTQLFDLEADPDEMHDLSKDAAHKDRIASLLARIEKAQQHYGDSQPLTVDHPKSPAWTPPAGP